MADLYTVGLEIDTSGGANSVRGLGRTLDDLADKGESVVGKLKSSFLGLAAASGLTILGAKLLKETVDSQNAMAQLEARVKSTGAAAGLTVTQLDDMSKALQQVTTYSDEATKNAESMLLTFNKVKGDTFLRATKDVQDLAAAMGGDLQGAAIQVGKALQDPDTGMLALRRSGVSFSQSQQQVIKDLFHSGQEAKAQALILKELEKEFGGTAQAARQTLGGALKGLANDFGDLFEAEKGTTSGTVSFINAIGGAIRWVGEMSEWLKSAAIAAGLLATGALLVQGAMLTMTAVQGSMWLFSITAAFGTASIAGTGFMGVLAGLQPLLTRMALAAAPVALVTAAFVALAAAIYQIRQENDTFESETVGKSLDLRFQQALAFKKKYGLDAARKIYTDIYKTPAPKTTPDNDPAARGEIAGRQGELDQLAALNKAYNQSDAALQILTIQKEADTQRTKDRLQYYGQDLEKLNALTDGIEKQKIEAVKLAAAKKLANDTKIANVNIAGIQKTTAAYGVSQDAADQAASQAQLDDQVAQATIGLDEYAAAKVKANLTNVHAAQTQLDDAKTLRQVTDAGADAIASAQEQVKEQGLLGDAARRASIALQEQNAITQAQRTLHGAAQAQAIKDAHELARLQNAAIDVGSSTSAKNAATDAIGAAKEQVREQLLVGDAVQRASIEYQRQTAIIQAQRNLDGDALKTATDTANQVAALSIRALDISKAAAPWKGLINNIENGVSQFASDLFTRPATAFSNLVDTIKNMWSQLIADLAKREFEKVLLPKIAGIFGLGAAAQTPSAQNVTAGTIMKQASQQMLQAAGIMANATGGPDAPSGGAPGAAGGKGSVWGEGAGIGIAAGTIGYGVGSMTTSRALGTLGGAASGAATGAAIGALGGPIGVATGALIGGIAGAVGGFFGAGNAAKKAAKQMKELQDALAINFAAYKAEITGDTLGAAIAQSQAQLKDILNQINAAYSGKKNETVRNQKRDEATALEAQNEQKIRQQFQADTQAQREDYEVRRLRALGQTKQADDLAFAQQQQREYAAAVKAGADATTLAALAQTQAAEKTAYATKATNDLTEALTNAPAGFKAAQDRWLASLPGNPAAFVNTAAQPNVPTPPKIIPGVDIVGPLTPSSQLNAAQQQQQPSGGGTVVNVTGPVTFQLPAGTPKEMVQAVMDEFERMSLRGGTNQMTLALRGR